MRDAPSVLLVLGGATYEVEAGRAHDISIPLAFPGPQPNAFGAPPATARAFETGRFIGDTRRGGSCNVDSLAVTPHCNGTHTECAGHLADARISVGDVLREALVPATLVTVEPVDAVRSSESYLLVKDERDRIITAHALRAAVRNAAPEFLEALVVRTAPNGESKRTRDWTAAAPPFFSVEAMHAVVDMGVRHLLVDLPSLDRADDEGRLSAHRVLWDLPPETHAVDPASCSPRTVTELIYVPDAVPDGRYLLNMQIASFSLDAAPSRPLLFPITRRL